MPVIIQVAKFIAKDKSLGDTVNIGNYLSYSGGGECIGTVISEPDSYGYVSLSVDYLPVYTNPHKSTRKVNAKPKKIIG